MKQERFVLAKKIKEFNMEVLDILVNFPKKYQEYRNNLVNDSINLLEIVYYANYTDKRLFMNLNEANNLLIGGIK